MAINQISTANTFGQLLTATSALITVANNLTDGPVLVANSQIQIRLPGTGLIVNSNVTVLNTITTGNLTVTSNFTASNVILTGPGASLQVSNTGAFSNIVVANTATVNVLGGNAVNQFDASGIAVAMAIVLG